MTQLRQDYAAFEKQDTVILAVGPDSHEDFKRFWQEKDLSFIGLADPDHKVAGLYDQDVKLLKFGRIPAQMLIDKNGVLQFVHYSRSMSDITENETILMKLEEINQ
jgi:peroxiredoxin